MSGAAEYTAYVRARLIPSLQRLRGFVALYLLRVATDTPTSDLTVITIWDSVDAVREFAGDDLTRAVVEPEAQGMLTTFDEHVHLHEVAAMIHRGDQREISGPEKRSKESDLRLDQ
jgi:heme-degrading monooxygenase HmoA